MDRQTDIDDTIVGQPVYAPVPPPPPRRRRRGRIAFFVVVPILVVIAALAAAAIVVVGNNEEKTTPGRTESEAFLGAWNANDLARMQTMVSDPSAPIANDLAQTIGALKPKDLTFKYGELQKTGEGENEKVAASFTATMTIPGLGVWSYQGAIPLQVGEDNSVKIVWSRTVIHPSLTKDQKLAKTRKWPDRAPILAGDGQPIVQRVPAVTVAAVPARIKDQAALAKALQDNLGLDPKTVDAALKQAWVKPESQVPLTSIKREVYDRVKPAIYDVPGLQFVQSADRLAPSETFAKHLLGRTGTITADQLEQLGAPYLEGDEVGQTGIESAYEKALAGTPGGDIHATDAADKNPRVLHEFRGTAPAPVKTTLDIKAQLAAEVALPGDKPGALVAVDKNGHIKAAVSRPINEEFNRALLGQYAPGSTFKVVTSAALLNAGVPADAPFSCPPDITVGGKRFRNFEGEEQAQLTFTDAFTISCNTAFIAGGQLLPPGALENTAKQFGFNAEYNVGLTSKGGVFPTPADKTEAAADSIGQGKVVASPLHMSTVAATGLSGQWHAPVLVTDPILPSATRPEAAPALSPPTQAQLSVLMHSVVARGTGVAAAVPGKDIAGKTGTAEFGSGNPPPTHAWFVGFDPELAVAAIVEGGGTGGAVAAPIVGRFFATR